MTNEEFQKIVLEELGSLKEGQKRLEGRQERLEMGQRKLEGRQERLEIGQKKLEERQERLEIGQRKLEERQERLEIGQRKLEERQERLEIGQEQIRKDLKAVVEQTVDLTEFRQETNEKLDSLIEDSKSIHGILGEHEVSIRTIRRRII